MKKKKIWYYLTYCISAAILIVLLSKINFSQIADVFAEAKIKWLIIALLIKLIACITVSVEKWRLILDMLGLRITLKEAFPIRVGSIPMKILSPAKLGAALRAVYMKKNYSFPLSMGILSIIIELMMNIWAAVMVVMIAGTLTGHLSAYWMLPVLLMHVFFLLWFRRKKGSIKNILPAWLKRKMRYTDDEKLSDVNMVRFVSPLILSFIYILLEIIILYLLVVSLNLSIPLLEVLFFGALTILISNLPISVSGIGTREAAVCMFFSKYGDYTVLFSLGFLFTIVVYFLPVFAGLLFMRKFLRRLI
ncbi:lysylphosphatidylglycerol synthase transmembrane domain-containing protein [Elusimicrobiota bacterium]